MRPLETPGGVRKRAAKGKPALNLVKSLTREVDE